jgi:hypothetical protein
MLRRWDNAAVELLTAERGALVTGFVLPRRLCDGWPCRRCAVVAVDTLERLALSAGAVTVEAGGLRVERGSLPRCVSALKQRPATLCPAQNTYDTNWRVDVRTACECPDCDARTWDRFSAAHPLVIAAVTRSTAAATRPFVAAALPKLVAAGDAETVELLFRRTPVF